jgi:hypothetical protein
VSISTGLRAEQTQLELRSLRRDISDWVDLRAAGDPAGQYHSQLEAIRSLLEAALGELEEKRRAVPLADPAQAYHEYRALDLRALWLRRVWLFFREKFDQRDDERLGPVLRAADEIVWSCYSQPLARLKPQGAAIGPVPLPYIEPRYSPEAFPAELVPPGLKSEIDAAFLSAHLRELPVAVVRLPPSCVTSPWWLIYLGHEVGHHVSAQAFRRPRLLEILDRLSLAAEDGERWSRWLDELFADVFSVLTMGPWAVWAMVELELKRPAEMLSRRGAYPPPAVRLLLLAEAARRLGLTEPSMLRGVPLAAAVAGDKDASRDKEIGGRLIEALLAEPLQGMTWGALFDFKAGAPSPWSPGQDVGHWLGVLRAEDPIQVAPAKKTKRAARLIASGAVAAIEHSLSLPEGDAGGFRARIGARMLALCPEVREVGRRGAKAEGDATTAGAKLGRALLTLSDEALGL